VSVIKCSALHTAGSEYYAFARNKTFKSRTTEQIGEKHFG